jgi:hypothetical protein
MSAPTVTPSEIAGRIGLSERMVLRYLVKLGLRPCAVQGRSNHYAADTVDRVQAAVLQARQDRADAVRQAIARRHSERTSTVITVREAKRRAQRGGPR